jgi:hypothetical protein
MLYNRDIYIRHYVMHGLAVTDYFRWRPGQLLVLDLAKPDAMRLLCEFLDIPYTGQPMPRLNPTKA